MNIYLRKNALGQTVTLAYYHLVSSRVNLPWMQPAKPAAFTLWCEFANTHLKGGIKRLRAVCGDTGGSINDLNP